MRGGGGEDELLRIDARIRGEHAARLSGLLRLGPRTRLDAEAVAGWIRDVEAEMRRGGSAWTAPSILLQGMGVDFAVERGALSTIFANLLRNAQAAAAGGEVIVRLGEERDAAGRNLTVLLVGRLVRPRRLARGHRAARERARALAGARPDPRVAGARGGAHRGASLDEGGGRLLPRAAGMTFIVCEDGAEYADRFQRFLGGQFAFVRAGHFADALALAAGACGVLLDLGFPPHRACAAGGRAGREGPTRARRRSRAS